MPEAPVLDYRTPTAKRERRSNVLRRAAGDLYASELGRWVRRWWIPITVFFLLLGIVLVLNGYPFAKMNSTNPNDPYWNPNQVIYDTGHRPGGW